MSKCGEIHIIGFARSRGVQWCNFYWILSSGWWDIFVQRWSWKFKNPFLNFCLTLSLNILVSFCSTAGKFIFSDSLGSGDSEYIKIFELHYTGWRDIDVFFLCLKFSFVIFLTGFFWWADFDCEYLSQFLSYSGEVNIFGFLRSWRIQWYQFCWMLTCQLSRY